MVVNAAESAAIAATITNVIVIVSSGSVFLTCVFAPCKGQAKWIDRRAVVFAVLKNLSGDQSLGGHSAARTEWIRAFKSGQS
jgi:hypothetical protein